MNRGKYLVMTSILALFMISGCSSSESDETNQSENKPVVTITRQTTESTEIKESETKITETIETTESSNTIKENSYGEVFHKLPEKVKVQIYAQIVDSNMEAYEGLDGKSLSYDIKGDDIYVFLNGDTGDKYPVYHLYQRADGIEPIQGVSHEDKDKYKEQSVRRDLTSYIELYGYYKSNQDALEKGEEHVKKEGDLAKTFKSDLDHAGVKLIQPNDKVKKAERTKGIAEPTEDDIMEYFIEYAASDIGMSGDNLREYVHYGHGIEGIPGDLVIRGPGSQAIHVFVEGDRIIYKGYFYGGAYEDGTPSVSKWKTAFYDMKTKEHGVIE